jgi:hypothetical protein
MSGFKDLEKINAACANEHSNLVSVFQGLPLVHLADRKWVATSLWKAAQEIGQKIGGLEIKEADRWDIDQLRQLQDELQDVELKLETSQKRNQTKLVGAAAMYVVTSAYTCYYTYKSLDASLGEQKQDAKEIEEVEKCLEDYRASMETWFSELLKSLTSDEDFDLYKSRRELECIKNLVLQQESRLTKITTAVENRIIKIKKRLSKHKRHVVVGVVLLSAIGYNIWVAPVGASAILLSGSAAGVALATALNIHCWVLAEEHVKMLEEQQSALEQLSSKIKEVLADNKGWGKVIKEFQFSKR